MKISVVCSRFILVARPLDERHFATVLNVDGSKLCRKIWLSTGGKIAAFIEFASASNLLRSLGSDTKPDNVGNF